MNTDVEAKIVKENSKRVSVDVAQEILRAVDGIEYGSVEIVIHDGKVVQIECREKIRMNQNGSSGRKASKA
ncbi:hypothetical protein C8R34_10796 [Nitrosomonas sp. Nm84]|uniref:YezD family protein n=1 Tax=Nitrosomonas sp. Nm84 TaxID=200124 RepID=UPI000D758F8E|nr:YezD family protein [Nitrosomonas sp. Nm84]PXW88413.1 hypothetical protein C8R34_10796 [Nitrosomonas sp. Nm84]